MCFENAKVVKKANVYFDGKVTSRTVFLADGERKTLGFMMPGEYKFSTQDAEVMEVLEGEAEIQLNGEIASTKYVTGERFSVPKNSAFHIKVNKFFDYCCSYIKE